MEVPQILVALIYPPQAKDRNLGSGLDITTQVGTFLHAPGLA